MSDNGTNDNVDAKLAARRAAEESDRRNTAAINGNLNTAKNNPTSTGAQRFSTDDVTIEDGPNLSIEDILKNARDGGADQDFEAIMGPNASKDAIELEYFMHETLVITVAESPNEEDPLVVCPVVNGKMQPIVRGVPTPVRRKYVEALARAKETKYRQVQTDSNRPDSLEMVPRTVVAYPFSVDHDPNPRGRDWLRRILKQPV